MEIVTSIASFPTVRLTSIGGEKPEFLHLDNDAKADATTHELQQIDGPLGEKVQDVRRLSGGGGRLVDGQALVDGWED